MKRLISLVVVALVLFSGSAFADCFGDCASDEGICISYCNGDGQCISRCASAHGRCVSRCN